MLTRFFAYLRGIVKRGRIAREVDDELRFHVEAEIDAHVARGVSPDEARRQALATLGGVMQTADAVREIRTTPVDRAQMAVRDAWRGLRIGRSSTVLAGAILTTTMALATVTFSVVDGIALRPLPFADADELVTIALPGLSPGSVTFPAPRDYYDWVDTAESLESIAAAWPGPMLALDTDAGGETFTSRAVTANLFDVLAVRPVAGRLFTAEDDRPGNDAVILGYEAWVRRFQGDGTVVGRQVRLGGVNRIVIGVLPPRVRFPVTSTAPPDAYTVRVTTPDERASTSGHGVTAVVGRRRSGVTVDQVRADLQRHSSAVVVPLHEFVVGASRTPLLLALAAVGVVLLVACVNVANLLMARATMRARELATREALGASRWQLAGILVLEGLLLACAAAAVGVLFAVWGVEVAKDNLPPGLMRVEDISINVRVLTISMVTAVICCGIFSTAPAWQAARGDLVTSMKATGGAVIGGRRLDRALGAFLIADVAFVSALLVATALVVTSFILITTADLGFDRDNVAMIGFNRTVNDLPEPTRGPAAVIRREILDHARSVSGVTAAAIAANATAPMSGGQVRYSMDIPGYGDAKGEDMLVTNMVTPDYFRVMGMQVLRGRGFESTDVVGAPLVMVINDAAASKFFNGRDPIGQVVSFRGPTTIVGVFKGVHVDGPESPIRPAMFVPIDQFDAYNRPTIKSVDGSLLVRTERDVREFAPAIREAVRPALSRVGQASFMDDYFRRFTAGRRFNAGLMAIFGVVVVAIGAVGIYGTMAFVVAQQVRTIGLHMALGAAPWDVLQSVLRLALVRVAIGAVIGLASAAALSGVVSSFIFGIRSTEPGVYAAVGIFLGLVGLGAAFVPARRASRLDPVQALRSE